MLPRSDCRALQDRFVPAVAAVALVRGGSSAQQAVRVFLLLCTQRFCLPSNLEFAVFRRYVVEDDSDDADVVAEWERARGW